MITTDGSILQTAGFIVCALLPFIPSILIYKQKKLYLYIPHFQTSLVQHESDAGKTEMKPR